MSSIAKTSTQFFIKTSVEIDINQMTMQKLCRQMLYMKRSHTGYSTMDKGTDIPG